MSLTSGTIEFLLKAETTGMRIEEARSIGSKGKVPHGVDVITLHFALCHEYKMSRKISNSLISIIIHH